MQQPPKLEGGQRRPLADDADVIVHETDEGMALVIHNKGDRQITMKYDFSQSENLTVHPAGGIDVVNDFRLDTVSEPGTAKNLCELKIKDESLQSLSMRYRVQCLVRNSRGELEQVGPGSGTAGGSRTASSSASGGGSGGGGGGSRTSSSSAGVVEGEEITKLSDGLNLVVQPGPNHGYIIVLESLRGDSFAVTINFSQSENLSVTAGNGVQEVEKMRLNGTIDVEGRMVFATLEVVNFDLGSCDLKYSISHRMDNSKRLAREAEEQKAAAEEAARLQAEREAAAKRAAEESARLAAQEKAAREAAEKLAADAAADVAARKLAQEAAAKAAAEADAARQKAAEEERMRAEAEAVARKAAEEEAAKLAEQEAERKRMEDEEAAKKAAEEEARLQAEAEEAAQRAAAAGAAAKAAAEAEAAQKKAQAEAALKAKREAELKKIATRKVLVEKEQIVMRLRFEAEWRHWWVIFERKWRESLCNLCRKCHVDTIPVVEYKDFRLHKPCFDAAPKCNVCGDILIGEYVQTKGSNGGVKLHKECIESYKKGTRPVCGQCSQQIMDQKWSTNAGVHYHTACRAQE